MAREANVEGFNSAKVCCPSDTSRPVSDDRMAVQADGLTAGTWVRPTAIPLFADVRSTDATVPVEGRNAAIARRLI